MSIDQVKRGSKRKWIKVFGKDRNKLIEELKDFVVNAYYVFNSSEITNHINTKLQTNNKASRIRSVMKRKLNLSIKEQSLVKIASILVKLKHVVGYLLLSFLNFFLNFHLLSTLKKLQSIGISK